MTGAVSVAAFSPSFRDGDPGQCVEPAAAPGYGLHQQFELDGEVIPYLLDSGRHDGIPGGETLAFRAVVESKGVPWIRLYFEQVSLGPEDYVKLRALRHGAEQTLTQQSVTGGKVMSAYFDGSAVEVSLYVAPSAVQSGFVVSSLEIGYPESALFPRKICDGADNRAISNDPRVCQLRMVARICFPKKTSIRCGCPGGVCGPADVCVGGARNGLDCGNAACTAGGDLCEEHTGFGTAFFIDGGAGSARCLLTSGHNFYGPDESFLQNGASSATLHCRVYGCGDEGTCPGGGVCLAGTCEDGDRDGQACAICANVRGGDPCPGGGVCRDGICDDGDRDDQACLPVGAGTCNGGARHGQFCVPSATAMPAEQYNVTVTDGERLTGDTPHDWALIKVAHNPGSFELIQADGDQAVTVTGHGTDHWLGGVKGGTNRNRFYQQTHTSTGTRPSATRGADAIDHLADTEGGNSGSPIIVNDMAWGIHNGGPGGLGNPPNPLCVSGPPPVSPNFGVYHEHDHAAGVPGRSLKKAIQANCSGHLKVYTIKDGNRQEIVPPKNEPGITLVNDLAIETDCHVITKAKLFMVDTAKKLGFPPEGETVGPSTSGVGHFLCYKVKKCRGGLPPDLMVKDQFGERMISFRRPRYLCTPADKWVCQDGDLDPGEECDPPDDAACKGDCAANCTCPVISP